MAVTGRFPKSTRTLVWEAVKVHLRKAPALSAVKTWFLFEGDPRKDGREWSSGDLPALEIRLGCGGPGRWIDEARQSSTLIFTHRFACEGSRQSDLLDMWAAIEGSWFDGTNTLQTAVQQWLAWQKTITGPVPEVKRVDGVLAMFGTGIITVNMDFDT